MSEKTKKILENLKTISQKESIQPHEPVKPIASNLGHDRLYGGLNQLVHLINQDGSRYPGKIHKRRITEQGIDGTNFFSHCFETADGRWFDRAGMPCSKPNNVVKQLENDEDNESK